LKDVIDEWFRGFVFDGATNILISQDESLLYYNVAKIHPDRDQIIKNFG
jgi:hypothetical protein